MEAGWCRHPCGKKGLRADSVKQELLLWNTLAQFITMGRSDRQTARYERVPLYFAFAVMWTVGSTLLWIIFVSKPLHTLKIIYSAIKAIGK